MSEQLANLYSSTLSVNYTTGAGQITVASATGAPSSGTFTVAITNAATGNVTLLFRVTSVSGTVFTGSAEGTDANAASGSPVIGTILSASAVTQIEADAASQAAVVKIAESILGSPAATVTFSSIPSTYRNLRVLIACRSATAAQNDKVYMQFNADTGANYNTQVVAGLNSTASIGNATSTAQAQVFTTSAASAPANVPGIGEIRIPFYKQTVFNKEAICQSGWRDSTPQTAENGVWFEWMNTAAITQIVFGLTSGANFVTGSSFVLYGEL